MAFQNPVPTSYSFSSNIIHSVDGTPFELAKYENGVAIFYNRSGRSWTVPICLPISCCKVKPLPKVIPPKLEYLQRYDLWFRHKKYLRSGKVYGTYGYNKIQVPQVPSVSAVSSKPKWVGREPTFSNKK